MIIDLLSLKMLKWVVRINKVINNIIIIILILDRV